MNMQQIGGYAFLLGVLIAIIAALVTLDMVMVYTLLVVLGLIVGFLNVTDKETTSFLVASVALILTASATAPLASVPTGGEYLAYVSSIMANIALFVAPAALIVALKAVWKMASSE